MEEDLLTNFARQANILSAYNNLGEMELGLRKPFPFFVTKLGDCQITSGKPVPFVTTLG